MGRYLVQTDADNEYSNVCFLNKINALAAQLRMMHQQPILVFLDASVEYLIAVSAILQSGNYFIPVSPVFPRSFIERVRNSDRISAVVARKTDRGVLQSMGFSNVFLIDASATLETNAKLAGHGEDLFPSNLPLDQPVYQLYTSGSTGKRKGVRICWGQLKGYFDWVLSAYTIDKNDIFDFSLDPSFDMSVTTTLLPLYAGNRISVLTERKVMDPWLYSHYVNDAKVTIIKTTPSYFRRLLDVSEHVEFNDVRLIILGGEALDTLLVKRWLNRYPAHRIVNEYGPTEATVAVTSFEVTKDNVSRIDSTTIPIGFCHGQTTLNIDGVALDDCQVGDTGKLTIIGEQVAHGYTNVDAACFYQTDTGWCFDTGDRVRWLGLPYGLEYIGRDEQIKVNGFRVAFGEVECWLNQHPSVQAARVGTTLIAGVQTLYAAIVPAAGNVSVDCLKAFLATQLPHYMVPAYYTMMNELPVTHSGKLDHARIEKTLFSVQKKRHVDRNKPAVEAWLKAKLCVNRNDASSAFDNHLPILAQGISSLQLIDLCITIEKTFNVTLTISQALQLGTIGRLAQFISGIPLDTNASEKKSASNSASDANTGRDTIAIIGMACEVSDIDSIADLWSLLMDPETQFTATRKDDGFFNTSQPLKRKNTVDAAFFGLSPKEAMALDPQQKRFLEVAVHTIEDAGLNAAHLTRRVGVFAGAGDNPSWRTQSERYDARWFHERLTRSPSMLSMRTSYHLNLTGPSITINSACSTSLSAICLAMDQLRLNHCDIALAGGVSIASLAQDGYVAEQDSILSKSGRCLPFDADADGTLFNDAAAVVVLKRLDCAIADGDRIYATILGNAITNDGKVKASFSAPSQTAQTQCYQAALRDSAIAPHEVCYIETHGTGTKLGDPLEYASIANVYASERDRPCYLGALKAKIGHTDAASGVLGLIKTSLLLHYGSIPPANHCAVLNPACVAEDGLVFNQSSIALTAHDSTAAISAFGAGGTNAHAILHRYQPSAAPASKQLTVVPFVLSAQGEPALRASFQQLMAQGFSTTDDETTAYDRLYTLSARRQHYGCRLGAVITLVDGFRLTEAFDGWPVHQAIKGTQPIGFSFLNSAPRAGGQCQAIYAAFPLAKQVLDDMLHDLHDKHLAAACLERLLTTQHSQPSADVAITAHLCFCFWLAQLHIRMGLRPTYIVGCKYGKIVALLLSKAIDINQAVQLADALENTAAVKTAADEILGSVSLRDDGMVLPIQVICPVRGAILNGRDLLSQAHGLADPKYTDTIPTIGYHRLLIIDMHTGSALERRPVALDCDYLSIQVQPAVTLDSLLAAWLPLWRDGFPIDWEAYYWGAAGAVVTLPGYPFSDAPLATPDVAPVHASASGQATDPCLWQPSWKRIAPNVDVGSHNPSRWLIITHDETTHTWQEWIAQHQLRATLIPITPRACWDDDARLSTIDENVGDVDDEAIYVIFDARADRISNAAFITDMASSMAKAIYRFCQVCLSLRQQYGMKKPIYFAIYTLQGQQVMGNEACLLDSSYYFSLLTVAVQEYGFNGVSIDVIETTGNPLLSPDTLVRLFNTSCDVDHVAVRGDCLWQLCFEPYQPPCLPEQSLLADNLTILVTGGLGGIGLEIMHEMACGHRAHFVILTRQSSPSDAVALKLAALRERGSTYEICTVNLVDAQEIDAAITALEARDITLNGIIHCAGRAGQSLIGNLSLDNITAVLSPKVYGLMRLCHRLRLHALDFLYCCGSMATYVGGVGQADYAAANALLSSVCDNAVFPNITLKRTINWSFWKDVGMAQTATIPDPIRENLLKNSLRVSEGRHIWTLAVTDPYFPTNLLCSRTKITDLIRDYAFDYYARTSRQGQITHAACSEDELKRLWCEILGDMAITRETHFYEVGGDSLSLMLLINAMNEAFNVTVAPCEAKKLYTFHDFCTALDSEAI